MTVNYQTAGQYCAREEIRRSEFITHVMHVSGEDELFARLSELRKKYSDATHVCYAAVLDASGNAARFSDDGEPSGTAGAPILEAIKQSGVKEVLVAVVRYFGGIKLGAGGLVRAYSSVASSALKAAPRIRRRLCDVYSLKTDFSRAKKISGVLSKTGIVVLNTEYSDCVTLTLAVDADRRIDAELSEMLAEKPRIEKIKTDYIEENLQKE